MAEGDLTPAQAEALVGPRPTVSGVNGMLSPMAERELAQGAATVPTEPNLHLLPSEPDIHLERLQKMGAEPGVPFHEEGLDWWTTLRARMREDKAAQMSYLMRRFGNENVRLNEYDEPVIRIPNAETGKLEDYPLNPRELTVKSFTNLLRFAPDVAMAYLTSEMGGNTAWMKRVGPLIRTGGRSLFAATGAEAGGFMRDLAAQELFSGEGLANPFDVEVKRPFLEHLANVPVDMAMDLGLAGLWKGGQAVINLGLPKWAGGQGMKLPNPIAGTPLVKPARPWFTEEVKKAAQDIENETGIHIPLRQSQRTGIPFVAMMERYFQRLPAGASPQIAAEEGLDQAVKDVQNYMINPATLPGAEQIGRSASAALKKSVEPYEEAVAITKGTVDAEKEAMESAARNRMQAAQQLARQKLTAQEQGKILQDFQVTDLPTEGAPLSEMGEYAKTSTIHQQAADKVKHQDLYNQLFANQKATEPIIEGAPLKAGIDDFLSALPKVQKTEMQASKLLDPSGNPVQIPVAKDVPISTPVRGRLEELSSKLDEGKVSLRDLKEIRTDIGDAITYGQAVTGTKDGRLTHLYGIVSKAIEGGLQDINDSAMTQLWKDATAAYKQYATKYEHKAIAPLFRESFQSGPGNKEFALKAINNQDLYDALKQFWGPQHAVVGALQKTARLRVLEEGLGPNGMIDGNSLANRLMRLREDNKTLFKDAFGGNGQRIIESADRLGAFQRNVPIEEVERLLTGPAKSQTGMDLAMIQLQYAQRKLSQQYQNQVVNRFARGDLKPEQLQPEKFVSYLRDANLTSVKDTMTRLQSESPEVAEQVRRKTIQQIFTDARREAKSTDVMAHRMGKEGQILSGSGIDQVLGDKEQTEKYLSILGPQRLKLIDAVAKVQLGRQNVLEEAAGVGMLAPGSAANAIRKALTPWEGHEKGKGMLMEGAGLLRDKAFSVIIASDAIQKWLSSPYALRDQGNAIKTLMVSQPFIRGLLAEMGDAVPAAKAFSLLKAGYGTYDLGTPATTQQTGGDLTPAQAEQLVGPRPK